MPRIDFPEGYESEFKNYLSLDRVQNPDQIIRLFANDIALEGRGEDGKFANGSILVGEIYAASKMTLATSWKAPWGTVSLEILLPSP